MKSATESELGLLHSKVAKAMLRQLDAVDTAVALLSIYKDELPEEVAEFLADVSYVSPALLGAVTKFLKDNDVNAAKDDVKELSELEQKLNKKKERKVIGNVIPMIEDDE